MGRGVAWVLLFSSVLSSRSDQLYNAVSLKAVKHGLYGSPHGDVLFLVTNLIKLTNLYFLEDGAA